jgi:threonine dehydratase
VVASRSPSYALSFAQRRIVEAPARTAIADGLACRMPNANAMEIIWQNVARIVEVTDEEITAAMRAIYEDTHNLAEGAAAAAFAGAVRESTAMRGKRIGIVLTGGNVDVAVFARVLAGEVVRA